jgi:hypothetical protein
MAVRRTLHLPETRIQPGHFTALREALASGACLAAIQMKKSARIKGAFGSIIRVNR